MQERPNVYDWSFDDCVAWLRQRGEPAFRARQLYRHLYGHLTAEPSAMTDWPVHLREQLAAETRWGVLQSAVCVQGDDGFTRKVAWTLPSGHPLESVLMVYPDRATVCVSSQSGCPMQCVFCATGKLGFLHDCSPGEIIEQVIWAAREIRQMAAAPGATHPDHLTNVVFMGMGEPFNNFDYWWTAVERLHDPQGFNCGARNFTVSTVGLVPGIERLANQSLPVNLAISLHAADDELRSAMMPVNKRYPIADLMAAARSYTEKTRRRVSFEYVLLHEKNDSTAQAEQLADWLRPAAGPSLLAHVNLIPWNPVPGAPLSRSSRRRVNDFKAVLQARSVPCTVRIERGVDIAAACGQLAGHAPTPTTG